MMPATVRAPLVKPAKHVVLCVEDDPRQLRLLKRILQKRGFSVLQAATAVEALELFHTNPVSLVVIDQRLGDKQMTGAQMSREIKALKPTLPVVLRSGYPSPRIGQTWDVFINKAESVETFLDIIEDLIRRYAA